MNKNRSLLIVQPLIGIVLAAILAGVVQMEIKSWTMTTILLLVILHLEIKYTILWSMNKSKK